MASSQTTLPKNTLMEQSAIHDEQNLLKINPSTTIPTTTSPNISTGMLNRSSIIQLQRTHGNQFVQRLIGARSPQPRQGFFRIQREETSFPEEAEEQLKGMQGGAKDEEIQTQRIQRKIDPALQRKVALKTRSSGAYSSTIQRRGGARIGRLYVVSNVVSNGLLAGHAWLRYEPDGGTATTYGTWGNVTPIGLHRDRELGQGHGAASRGTDVDATDVNTLNNFANSHNTWGLTRNCAWFAALGWWTVTGESIDHTTMGIPNPSALGAGIAAKGGDLAAAPSGSSNSSGSSSAQGSGSSTNSSNVVSSGHSSSI